MTRVDPARGDCPRLQTRRRPYETPPVQPGTPEYDRLIRAGPGRDLLLAMLSKSEASMISGHGGWSDGERVRDAATIRMELAAKLRHVPEPVLYTPSASLLRWKKARARYAAMRKARAA